MLLTVLIQAAPTLVAVAIAYYGATLMRRAERKMAEVARVSESAGLVSAELRFSRRIQVVHIDKSWLEELHFHKFNRSSVVHLVHLLRMVSDLPDDAMLRSARMNIQCNQLDMVFESHSFPELENEYGKMPELDLKFHKTPGLVLSSDQCPSCIMRGVAQER